MFELVSKHPENAWCKYYHIEVDGQIHYVYEGYILTGYGMTCTPSDYRYLLISHEMYDSEHPLCSGPMLYSSETCDSPQRINEGVAQGIRRLMAQRASQNSTTT